MGFLFIYRTMWNVLISIGDGAGEDTVCGSVLLRASAHALVPILHLSLLPLLPPFSVIIIFLAVLFSSQ